MTGSTFKPMQKPAGRFVRLVELACPSRRVTHRAHRPAASFSVAFSPLRGPSSPGNGVHGAGAGCTALSPFAPRRTPGIAAAVAPVSSAGPAGLRFPTCLLQAGLPPAHPADLPKEHTMNRDFWFSVGSIVSVLALVVILVVLIVAIFGAR